MNDTLSKIFQILVSLTLALLNAFNALLGALTGTPAPTDPTDPSQPPETTVTQPATPTPPEGDYDSDTFVFTMYGYGHGVGMSQEGSFAMARSGYSYEQILTHYFTGTTIKTDPNTPSHIKYGGVSTPIVEYMCKTARAEIGTGQPKEAIKAQLVLIYTYAKWYDFDVSSSRHAYNSGFNYIGTDIHQACLEVLAMSNNSSTPNAKYVDYNGEPAFTCYFASSAGKTTSAENTWGGSYPYLVPVTSPETVDVRTITMTSAELKAKILAYDSSIQLDDNPANWIKILQHDSAVNASIGYVSKMTVGNKEMKGETFRGKILGYSTLRSHCFTVAYYA